MPPGKASGRAHEGCESPAAFCYPGSPATGNAVTKQVVEWSLFLIQMGCAALFGLGQFWQMLSSTEGVSMSWFAAWEVFLVMNLWLAWQAHRARPSLVTGQTFAIYAFYAALIALDLAALLLRKSWTWTGSDSLTAALVVSGCVVTLVAGAARGQSIRNPLVMGALAVFFKAVPQLVLAWNIYRAGGAGLALTAIVAGHVTILMRLAQLGIAIREAGWDRNRIGSFISEVPNELSWIVVTAVWLAV